MPVFRIVLRSFSAIWKTNDYSGYAEAFYNFVKENNCMQELEIPVEVQDLVPTYSHHDERKALELLRNLHSSDSVLSQLLLTVSPASLLIVCAVLDFLLILDALEALYAKLKVPIKIPVLIQGDTSDRLSRALTELKEKLLLKIYCYECKLIIFPWQQTNTHCTWCFTTHHENCRPKVLQNIKFQCPECYTYFSTTMPLTFHRIQALADILMSYQRRGCRLPTICNDPFSSLTFRYIPPKPGTYQLNNPVRHWEIRCSCSRRTFCGKPIHQLFIQSTYHCPWGVVDWFEKYGLSNLAGLFLSSAKACQSKRAYIQIVEEIPVSLSPWNSPLKPKYWCGCGGDSADQRNKINQERTMNWLSKYHREGSSHTYNGINTTS